jgi:protein disulfide-isomerase A6
MDTSVLVDGDLTLSNGSCDGRPFYWQMLEDLAAKYKDRPFSYLWAEGGSQPNLEAAFEVGGYGYPALIAFNPGEGRWAPMKGAFEAEQLSHFIERLRQVCGWACFCSATVSCD